MAADQSSSSTEHDSLLPVHTDSATAPEVYQRAPTLMAGASPGGGGAVRVWAPDRWRLWMEITAISLVILAVLALSFGYHIAVLACSGGLFVGLVVSIRALLHPCYITTDDSGIGITTREGSRSFRWMDIERCDVLMTSNGHPLRMTFYVPQRLQATLTGYSPRRGAEFLKIVTEKVNLVRDPDFTHPDRYVRASSLRARSQRVLAAAVVPIIAGIGAAFERDTEGQLLVSAIEDGSPAGDAGLMPGDAIQSINNFSVDCLNEVSATAQCRGPEGALIHLKVSRELWVKDLEFQVRTKSPFG